MTEILGLINDDESVWYVSGASQTLIQLSKDTLEVVNSIPINKIPYHKLSFSDGVAYANELIWAPFSTSQILMINKKTFDYEMIEIEKCKKGLGIGYFNKIVYKNEKLYFVPLCYHAMIEMDLFTKEIVYHNNPINILNKKYEHVSFYFKDAEWINDEVLILPFYDGNDIVIYNVRTKETHLFTIGGINTKLHKCILAGNELFVLPRNENCIYICKDNFSNIEERCLGESSDFYMDKRNFSNPAMAYFADLIDCDSFYLVIQSSYPFSFCIDKKSKKIEAFKLVSNKNELLNIIWCVKKISKEIILFAGLYENKLLGEFSINTKTLKWIELPKPLSHVFKQFHLWSIAINEEVGTSLYDFLEQIKTTDRKYNR